MAMFPITHRPFLAKRHGLNVPGGLGQGPRKRARQVDANVPFFNDLTNEFNEFLGKKYHIADLAALIGGFDDIDEVTFDFALGEADMAVASRAFRYSSNLFVLSATVMVRASTCQEA